MVDGKCAVRELYAAEEGFHIWVVEDRNISKRRLVNSQKRLVKPVDQLLELLAKVVVRVLHVVSVLNVLFPEVPRPDQDVWHTNCTALTVREERNKFDYVIKICSQMLWPLVVVIVKEK